MASLVDTLVPSVVYNSLPNINIVANTPVDHSQDLKDLQALLDKHGVSKNVCIRLIHKHFDTKEGEVMVFEKVVVSSPHSEQCRP